MCPPIWLSGAPFPWSKALAWNSNKPQGPGGARWAQGKVQSAPGIGAGPPWVPPRHQIVADVELPRESHLRWWGGEDLCCPHDHIGAQHIAPRSRATLGVPRALHSPPCWPIVVQCRQGRVALRKEPLVPPHGMQLGEVRGGIALLRTVPRHPCPTIEGGVGPIQHQDVINLDAVPSPVLKHCIAGHLIQGLAVGAGEVGTGRPRVVHDIGLYQHTSGTMVWVNYIPVAAGGRVARVGVLPRGVKGWGVEKKRV